MTKIVYSNTDCVKSEKKYAEKETGDLCRSDKDELRQHEKYLKFRVLLTLSLLKRFDLLNILSP